MKDCLSISVKEYIEELSGKSIAPGGGSASALTAAVGAGLNLMVLSYSIKENTPEAEVQELIWARERQEASKERVSLLVEEDCKAFRVLMEALSSKEADEGHYIQAAKVPVEVCRECHISMEVTKRLIDNANMNLVTDIGCAAHILKAAFYAAKLNVEINMKYIKDELFVKNTASELGKMQEEIDEVEEYVKTRLAEIAS
jgi:formiminotetrahydrofolate cyclodeaminase